MNAALQEVYNRLVGTDPREHAKGILALQLLDEPALRELILLFIPNHNVTTAAEFGAQANVNAITLERDLRTQYGDKQWEAALVDMGPVAKSYPPAGK